ADGPQRGEQRLVGGPLCEHGAEGGLDLVGLVEAGLVLGGEVAEERARRDVGGRGDVLDRRRRVTAALEEVEGGVRDGTTGALLLALAQARGAHHGLRRVVRRWHAVTHGTG